MDYPSFLQLVTERHSCRAYDPVRPVTRLQVNQILEAARLAPSACNRQPWHFYVIEGQEGRQLIQQAYDRAWLQDAPAYIVVCARRDEAWHRGADGRDHSDIDAAIATEHICLAAASLGLGTCWVCNFDPEALGVAMGLEDEGLTAVAIIPVGYPAEAAAAPQAPKNRKPLDEIVTYGAY